MKVVKASNKRNAFLHISVILLKAFSFVYQEIPVLKPADSHLDYTHNSCVGEVAVLSRRFPRLILRTQMGTLNDVTQERQCTNNAILRRLRETMVVLESNKYYILVCVCLCL